MSAPTGPMPKSLRKEGDSALVIDWVDGHHSIYTWKHLRDACPCATCRDERDAPPNPFRILSEKELVPLKLAQMVPVGRYAYKLVWSDGHDTGLYTLEALRGLCQCDECKEKKA